MDKKSNFHNPIIFYMIQSI